MPGVPYEMEYIMTNGVLPRLKNRFISLPIAHRTVLTVGEGESRLALKIEDFENNLPSHIKLAYLPSYGRVRLRLSARGVEEGSLTSDLSKKVAELKLLLKDIYVGDEDDTSIERVVNE